MKTKLFFLVMVFFLANLPITLASFEITDERSNADYWISRIKDGDKLLMTATEIENFNSSIRLKSQYLYYEIFNNDKKEDEEFEEEEEEEDLNSDKKNKNREVIGGGIGGGLGAIFTIGFFYICCCKNKENKDEDE